MRCVINCNSCKDNSRIGSFVISFDVLAEPVFSVRIRKKVAKVNGNKVPHVHDLRVLLKHLQAALHAYCLRVLVHVDDVLPGAAARLRQLRPGVLHLGRAKEAAVLGEVAVSVSVLPLAPANHQRQRRGAITGFQ